MLEAKNLFPLAKKVLACSSSKLRNKLQHNWGWPVLFFHTEKISLYPCWKYPTVFSVISTLHFRCWILV